jgi:subtilisin family serine protease
MQVHAVGLRSGENPSRAAQVRSSGSDPLTLVNLGPLMARGTGRPEVVVGLIDGPVASGIPYLASENIRTLPGAPEARDKVTDAACEHGTMVASVLSSRRSSAARGICPGCTLLVRPVFLQAPGHAGHWRTRATPGNLAVAVLETIDAGARILNISAALVGRSAVGERMLGEALDEAMRRGTIVVAAAGNQELIGGSVITAHPWVIPVVSYRLNGSPQRISNLGASIGRQGLGAPGERIVTFDPRGQQVEATGTSVATPFVTGAIALLWSQYPAAPAAAVRFAVSESGLRRQGIVPPLMDAWAAYGRLRALC